MSTHNIGFNEDLTKIIFELSSNTHLISSAVKLRYYSSSVNSIFQKCMCSNPVNLMSKVWSEHASYFIFLACK